MEAIVKPTIVLLVICIVISASLAFTYALTKERIEASDLLEANKARAEVLPDAEFEQVFALSDEEIAQNNVYPVVTEIYSATLTAGGADGAGGVDSAGGADGASGAGEVDTAGGGDKTAAGYVATIIAYGYGGSMQVIVGISADMKVTGVRLTKHSETPGLGANASEPWFLNQFAGKDTSSMLGVAKNAAGASSYDIVAISGATVTSSAVTQAVNAAVDAINALD